MILFGSRWGTVVLYALAVMLLLFLGDCVMHFILGHAMRKTDGILWAVTAVLTVTAEALYSELDFWRHHNGMAGVWIYIGMPFFAGLCCRIAESVLRRIRG